MPHPEEYDYHELTVYANRMLEEEMKKADNDITEAQLDMIFAKLLDLEQLILDLEEQTNDRLEVSEVNNEQRKTDWSVVAFYIILYTFAFGLVIKVVG
jgi:hypothetical protein